MSAPPRLLTGDELDFAVAEVLLLYDGVRQRRVRVTKVISNSEIEVVSAGWLWWNWATLKKRVIGLPSLLLWKLEGLVERVKRRFSASTAD